MKRIKIKSETFTVDRIVSFGCSFSAGTELLDHKLGPFATSKLSYRTNGKKLHQWYTDIHNDGKYREIMNTNKLYHEPSLAWPSKLAEKLEICCKNFAQPGNSNDKLVYQIQKLFNENFFRPTDLIIVGITSIHRGILFNPKSFTSDPESFLIAEADSYKKYVNPKFLLDWMSDERLVWQHIQNLSCLQNLKNLLNGRLLCLNMLPLRIKRHDDIIPLDDLNPSSSKLFYNIDDNFFTPFKLTLEQIYQSRLFLTKDCFYDMVPDEEQLPFFHPNESAHSKYASWLLNNFFQDLN